MHWRCLLGQSVRYTSHGGARMTVSLTSDRSRERLEEVFDGSHLALPPLLVEQAGAGLDKL